MLETGLPKDDQFAVTFGQVVWLYSMSELHRNWAFNSIHHWILPALQRKQYRIYHRGKKPVGFVSWAYLDAETEQAYVRKTTSLRSDGWRSGDRLWLIDFIAPFGDAKEILKELKYDVFKDDTACFLRAKPRDDVMRIMYVHGVNARRKNGSFGRKAIIPN